MYKMAITKEAAKEEVKAAEKEEKKKAQAELEEAPTYDVHTIIRGISLTNQFGQDGSQPASVVDAYLTEYLNRGYKLAYVQHLDIARFEGTPQPIAVNMMYVMVREE